MRPQVFPFLLDGGTLHQGLCQATDSAGVAPLVFPQQLGLYFVGGRPDGDEPKAMA